MKALATALAISAAALGGTACAEDTAPPANCTLQVKASLDMLFDATGRITVPVGINGHPIRLMLDTGDYQSIITLHTAQDLGLTILSSPKLQLTTWGGGVISLAAKVDEFSIGRMKAHNTDFMVSPDFILADGLLGADYLNNFDVDFDFAKARVDLISPDHCPGHVISWTEGPYAVVPFQYQDRNIALTVKLDGKDVPAMLDTGAAATVMSLETASDISGVDEDDLKKDPDHHPFKQMSFGGVSVTNPAIKLVPENESVIMGRGQPKLIVGMTVLRRLHLYLSYKEQKLYVTPATQY